MWKKESEKAYPDVHITSGDLHGSSQHERGWKEDGELV